MRTVKFSVIPVDAWFKESEGGLLYLKVDACSGMCQQDSTPRYRPRFAANEVMLVD